MQQTRNVLAANTLRGDKVINRANEDLGKLEEIMIELSTGKVAYAVLSFGGFLGLGDKYFAIPWNKINVDQKNKCIILNVDKEHLKNAPGFDKNHWPDMADTTWTTQITNFYNRD